MRISDGSSDVGASDLLGLERGAMYALRASGLSLIFGIMGVKNFSHGELFMLGGYVMFYVTMVLDLPWPIGVAAAALVLLVVGMLIERTLIEDRKSVV